MWDRSVGGYVPRPGEVSRAHRSSLFLVELPELKRHVLEVLRQPLENAATQLPSPDILDLAAMAARMGPGQTVVPQR
jgi:Magnesium chelatase, subunit ChlI